jgi:hypothetical protein
VKFPVWLVGLHRMNSSLLKFPYQSIKCNGLV